MRHGRRPLNGFREDVARREGKGGGGVGAAANAARWPSFHTGSFGRIGGTGQASGETRSTVRRIARRDVAAVRFHDLA
jgi:hypothetical protein